MGYWTKLLTGKSSKRTPKYTASDIAHTEIFTNFVLSNDLEKMKTALEAIEKNPVEINLDFTKILLRATVDKKLDEAAVNLDVIELILAQDYIDVSKTGGFKQTILHYLSSLTVDENQQEQLNRMVSRTIEINDANEKANPKNTRRSKQPVDEVAFVNMRDVLGGSAYTRASIAGNVNVMDTLLKSGAEKGYTEEHRRKASSFVQECYGYDGYDANEHAAENDRDARNSVSSGRFM